MSLSQADLNANLLTKVLAIATTRCFRLRWNNHRRYYKMKKPMQKKIHEDTTKKRRAVNKHLLAYIAWMSQQV